MSRSFASILVAAGLSGALVSGQTVATPPSIAPLAGRWEVQSEPSAATNTIAPAGPISLFILQIGGDDTKPTAELIGSAGSTFNAVTITRVALDGNRLLIRGDSMENPEAVYIDARRVGDHLEGILRSTRARLPETWMARTTTATRPPPLPPPDPRPDQAAFRAAMAQPPAARSQALADLLKAFPESPLRDRAMIERARAQPDPSLRAAAERQFLQERPTSPLRDVAAFDVARVGTRDQVRANLQTFLNEYRDSAFREAAAYLLITATVDAAEKLRAQSQFVIDYPNSPDIDTVYRGLLEGTLAATPVDEPRLQKIIAGFLSISPNVMVPAGGGFRINPLGSAMNTIADRLMSKEVLLDQALRLVEAAVAGLNDLVAPRTRAIYVTTLGQVLYKQHNYARAETELKRAIAIAGESADGVAQLFLGKVYEAQHNDQAALDAYLQAAIVTSTADTRSSVERLYAKSHGSTADLDDTLDRMFRARAASFVPDHYVRPRGPDPARVVLAELFTGAECEPCGNTDLAFASLAQRYDREAVALLVYHLTIGAPDPMVNADATVRARFYGATGSGAVVDGVPVRSPGTAADPRTLAANYRQLIDPKLNTPPQALLTGFRSHVEDGHLIISGEASLPATEGYRAGRASLHLAIAQESVRYAAASGIRLHSFVVRKFVGSATGTRLNAAGTPLTVSETVDLAAVSAAQDAYASRLEQDWTANQQPDFRFKNRIPGIDAAQLVVVAFVQDDQTREVLQAVVKRDGG